MNFEIEFISTGVTANISAGVTAGISAGVTADISAGVTGDISAGVTADISVHAGFMFLLKVDIYLHKECNLVAITTKVF